MRALFGCLAVLLGAVSITLAARYGYRGADTATDGVISAVVFGAIALCAFLFDAAAVRLWFMGHRIGSGAIGIIATAALIVTFTNSLGAIASRADTTLAERTRAADARKDDRAELKRLQEALAAIGKFTPTDAAAVAAAKRAADTATSNRVAECEKRGPYCRQREVDEQSAADHLAVVTAAKAATDRASKIEAEIAAVRSRLAEGPAVANPNPLGSALALMLGAGAAALTAWQQAIVAGVFELCLVGVMVIYELLGHRLPAPSTARAMEVIQHQNSAGRSPEIPPIGGVSRAVHPRPALPPPRRTAARKPRAGPASSHIIKSFVRDHVFPADGERVAMKAMVDAYRAWCDQKGVASIDLDKFLDEIERLCGKLGIEIKVGDDERVYCLNVRIEPTPAGSAREAASFHH